MVITKKFNWYKVMAKMRGMSSSPTLLAGVQIGTTTWENSLALASGAEHICILWTSDSTSRYIHNRNVYLSPSKNMHNNVYFRTMVMPKYWPDHKCPSTLNWINKVWYFHTIKYYTEIRNEILVHHQQG